MFDGHLGGHHVISLLLFPEAPKTSRYPLGNPHLSRTPIPGRAELSVSISMLGIRVYFMTNFTDSLMGK